VRELWGLSENEYAVAVSEFLRKKGVTRCPTPCIVSTHGKVPEADRAALRNYAAPRSPRNRKSSIVTSK
jgi:hypothetical protein